MCISNPPPRLNTAATGNKYLEAGCCNNYPHPTSTDQAGTIAGACEETDANKQIGRKHLLDYSSVAISGADLDAA